jgi:putative PIN family toxin of toxin-antitoxin system
LIVCHELIDEYLGVFRDLLAMDDQLIDDWRQRFVNDFRATVVNLGQRFVESRDPGDDLLLATAAAGRANYLVTNDRDLLDLPRHFTRNQRFEIVRPGVFLQLVNESM